MNQQHIEEILQFWKESDAFKQSVTSRSAKLPFKFYDGPPFTSGDPHYGHLLQSVVKDMVPRWMTMRGYRVNRKWGWDCHGIPAENFVNKQLGITSRKQVEEEFGIKEYVESCRSMVNNVNDTWKRFVDHVGRRVDMENAYFTMDNDFMESVVHLFSDLYKNNLIYKGFKVLGYSRALGTALSNSEIAEGYEMRQDPAVTVTLPLENRKFIAKHKQEYSLSDDGCMDVVAGIIERDGKYLMIHHTKENFWLFPGGKVHAGEYPVDALKRELHEEVGVKVTSEKFLGNMKVIHQGVPYRLHYFHVDIDGEPTLQEKEKHGDLKRVGTVESEDGLGFVIKIDDILVSDPQEIQNNFADYGWLRSGVLETRGLGDAPINFLAWTTTPWTLPSNMFLAVNKEITYVMIYDPEEKAYYVLAEALLDKYWKDSSAYVFVYRFPGSELVGLEYTPLFDYYHSHPEIPENYKHDVHQILAADFVTADSGTGIAHEAPAFGEDDYNLVCQLFPREKAQEWLFDPVDGYGDFTSLVPERAGENIIASNKAILQHLKDKGRVAKLETIDHSYPHCPRTGEPLIYKALESWFVKEDELKAQTVTPAKNIHFVPDSVKNRFVNGLQSAPDWNISRTRFWGCPLPVWESEDGEERVVLGSLEEIYQANRPKKQITKIILIRHGRTDYNEKGWGDSLVEGGDKARLNEQGEQQAQLMVEKFADLSPVAVYSSPMTRCKQTLAPLVEKLGVGLTEDTRLREVDMPFNQDKAFDATTWTWNDDAVDSENALEGSSGSGESVPEVYTRVEEFLKEVAEKHAGETIVVCTHGDPLVLLRKAMHDFKYEKQKSRWYISNASEEELPAVVEYVFADTGKKVDLHRPYIDEVIIVNKETGNELNRIPEVLDCWFESGSMPYGQDHWMKSGNEDDSFTPCADFIAEGLDQTRGWFRALHVLGHAYSQQNTFDNVVVTGMILAEDGKKMSKRLKNYPDPSYLLNQYGADPLRLYFLGSPVVRSEPLRFSEKGVEQVLKDFVIPLENVVNFFSTYAKIDTWTHPGTQITFMRHAHADHDEESSKTFETDLTDMGYASLTSPEFIEKVTRVHPEVIISSDFVRAQKTAQGAQDVMKLYAQKDVEIVTEAFFGSEYNDETFLQFYQDFQKKYQGKRILIISHKGRMQYMASHLLGSKPGSGNIDHLAVFPAPLVALTSELDQWIYSELYATLDSLNTHLEGYHLELATKELLTFVEKMTNRWLRRSRRRFWAEGMEDDKNTAYHTLFGVMMIYLRMAAPFTPFVTEKLWNELRLFIAGEDEERTAKDSVHLQYWPLASDLYINEHLMDEIATVRKIIKGAMYIRAKQQIKVKQPLQELRFRI